MTDCDGLITNLTNANNAARMRPQDWAAIDGLYILDADGWRTADAPPFDQPITREEYQRRIGECTVGPLNLGPSA